LLTSVNGACRPSQPLPAALPTPTVALSSEDLPAMTRVELAITNLSEVVSDDKAKVVIGGRVANGGTRPTTSVRVQVRALDHEGRTLREARVTPITERIPAGGSARFSVVFPNDPAVVDYHVEVIGYGRKVDE
jgi:hypothetical protein